VWWASSSLVCSTVRRFCQDCQANPHALCFPQSRRLSPVMGMLSKNILSRYFLILSRSCRYPIENHFVTTQDGYILQMQRIPYGLQSGPSPNRRPILLQHGLLDTWGCSNTHSLIL
jgi:hypothetical protein